MCSLAPASSCYDWWRSWHLVTVACATLSSLGAVSDITLGGAIATGVHGSGLKYGIFSTQVQANSLYWLHLTMSHTSWANFMIIAMHMELKDHVLVFMHTVIMTLKVHNFGTTLHHKINKAFIKEGKHKCLLSAVCWQVKFCESNHLQLSASIHFIFCFGFSFHSATLNNQYSTGFPQIPVAFL